MNSLEGDRTRFTLAIGSADESELNDYTRAVTEALSAFTAGATVLEGEGYWRSDGNGTPPYMGTLQVEHARLITFVTDLPRSDALQRVKNVARTVHAQEEPTGIEWINVEMETVQSCHFDASEFPGSTGDVLPQSSTQDEEIEDRGTTQPNVNVKSV